MQGFQANFEEFAVLLRRYKPAVFRLQETFLTSSKTPSFSGFNILTKNSLHDRATRGVALLINKSYLFSEVHLNTPLQAVAARVMLNKVITFCSVYLPPSDHVPKTDLINLIEQLPSPFILLGDFSGHSPVWGNESYNSRGQVLEDLFSEMNLCILNDGSLTYIHPTTSSTSALDLYICGPSLVLDYEWNIHEDLCESGHFPVILTSNAVEEEAAPNRWNFKKADWLSFQAQCTSELTDEVVMSARDPAGQFTDLLIQAANKAIPKTRFSKNLPKVTWFNDSCKRAIKERKKAQQKFFSDPTLSNVENFNFLRAKAHHVVKQQKRNLWRHFCNNLNCKTQTQGYNSVNRLKVNSNLITNKKEVAKVLAKNLSKNSLTDYYSDEFQRIKTLKEKRHLDFSSKNEEEYNLAFSVTELRQSLQRANDSAIGLDQVHYQLLTNLPNSAMSVLLKVFNHVWESGCFLSSWREAVVIPIPNPVRITRIPVISDL